MNSNPLVRIQQYGQSIWLDFIRRGTLISGELRQLIQEDGLRGVTSNPAIFEKAIDGSEDYSAAVHGLTLEGKSSSEIYETLVVEDIRQAADELRPLFNELDGRDGFVSLEVSPLLARDAQGTIREARRLWKALDRPNVFIKVPGTEEGLIAIRKLIGEGINVNVTLLFGLKRYRQVVEAYISGLEEAFQSGRHLSNISSVASFFLSRIDILVDPMLQKVADARGARADSAKDLIGQVAIASAKVAYGIYREILATDRWRKLADKGARAQRLLWASTSTKNPEYSDVKYVEPLIGPDTVNTLPMETLNAYRDHGNPASRLEQDADKARHVLDLLPEMEIDLDKVTQQLEDEGVEKFAKPFNRLMAALEEKRKEAIAEPVDSQEIRPGTHEAEIRDRLAEMSSSSLQTRIWRKDRTLWKTDPPSQKSISNSLGWLHVAEKMMEAVPLLESFAREMKDAGYRHVVHMGMGGSSLAPLVMQRSLPRKDGMGLTVLDTTDPGTILRIEREIPLEKTLFIVASKSGTTAEPLAFGEYFFHRLKETKGNRGGENFLAITDPGTPLEELARDRRFRRVFRNFKDIGGRYSALSYFGMVPAALAGHDIAEILERSLRMAHACASCISAGKNPALVLAAAIGELARAGKDKLTFVSSAGLDGFDLWLEQLLAESTGKEGRGILPVACETIGEASDYGDDRVFVHLTLADADGDRDARVKSLAQAGFPVITIRLKDVADLGQEFFRWELATAVAGSVLGIDPFDQPNVQESKENTNRLLGLVETEGKLPQTDPSAKSGSLKFFGDGPGEEAREVICSFLGTVRPGDYLSLQAYLMETQDTQNALQDLRLLLRNRMKVATTLGYGPRFLHSTGQFHKGGPNTGVFLQLTADDPEDVPIPGRTYGFGTLKAAQALGDFQALQEHHRRVMRVHLGPDAVQGLKELKEMVQTGCATQ